MRKATKNLALASLCCGCFGGWLLAQRPANHYTPPSAAQSVKIGNFYFRQKDYRGALDRYKEATRTDPMYAPGYLGLGKVCEKLGQKRKALAAYRRYLDTLPSEKQAEDDKEAHKAIRRLERELADSGAARSSTKAGHQKRR